MFRFVIYAVGQGGSAEPIIGSKYLSPLLDWLFKASSWEPRINQDQVLRELDLHGWVEIGYDGGQGRTSVFRLEDTEFNDAATAEAPPWREVGHGG